MKGRLVWQEFNIRGEPGDAGCERPKCIKYRCDSGGVARDNLLQQILAKQHELMQRGQ